MRAAPNTTRLQRHLCEGMWYNMDYIWCNSTVLLQEITLSQVLDVRGPTQLSTLPLPGDGTHSFEVATASLVYYVGAEEDGEAWADAIHQALMPIEESKNGEEIQGERATNAS